MAATPRHTPLSPYFGTTPSTHKDGKWCIDACADYVERLVYETFDELDLKPEQYAVLTEIAQETWMFAIDEKDLVEALRIVCVMLLHSQEGAEAREMVETTLGSCHIQAAVSPCDDDVVCTVRITDPKATDMMLQSYDHDKYGTLDELLKIVPTRMLVAEMSKTPHINQIFDMADDMDSFMNRPVQRLFEDEGETAGDVVGFDPNVYRMSFQTTRLGGGGIASVYPVGIDRIEAMNLTGHCRMTIGHDGYVLKIVHPQPSISPMTEWVIGRSSTPELIERYMRCAPYGNVENVIGRLDVEGRRHEVIYQTEKGMLLATFEIAEGVYIINDGIEIAEDMPETIRLALVGEPATRLLNHPLMEGLTITGHGCGGLFLTRFEISREQVS